MFDRTLRPDIRLWQMAQVRLALTDALNQYTSASVRYRHRHLRRTSPINSRCCLRAMDFKRLSSSTLLALEPTQTATFLRPLLLFAIFAPGSLKDRHPRGLEALTAEVAGVRHLQYLLHQPGGRV
eukprot:CAMPEP_0167818800 /NCGR_PEP_ID=MMETSP0112_2-20121227/5038_1 /TAXON_ID=91324 /ORGANISM="Lotharella globosa, Strain CCCM811" /LENGTH=124 /DNA_ID=CAMNT_0007718889 /DNA_START=566 /DNA_END=939 /DNA_ORIENTATION=+